MSSFLWLLLYLAPLLGLTAAVFAWLGWKWRGTDLQKRLQELQTRMDDMQAARSAGEVEQDTLHDRATKAEADKAVLHEELKSVQAEALVREGEMTKSQEFSHSLKSELARLIHELDTVRLERDHSAAALTTAHAEIERLRSAAAVEAAPPAPAPGPKRTRSTTPKVQTPAGRHASLQETLASVDGQLAKLQSSATALIQERDDWQRRVTKLESQPIADPAGLGLAYRSLADSEKRLQASSSEIDRLQNQSRVLRGVAEGAAALAAVPDDDLTRIKGIKAVISEQLRAHGIRTWRQIAEWNDDELRAFSELLAFKNRATREKWKDQARALHESINQQLL